MQRCLSGLRSTIGNRVMRERIRRFKSSSLRQKTKGIQLFCRILFFVPIFSKKCEIPHFIPHFLHTKFAPIFKKSERSDCTNSPIARVPPTTGRNRRLRFAPYALYPLNTNQRGCVSFVLNRKRFHTHAAPTYRRPCDGACPSTGGSRHASLPTILSFR